MCITLRINWSVANSSSKQALCCYRTIWKEDARKCACQRVLERVFQKCYRKLQLQHHQQAHNPHKPRQKDVSFVLGQRSERWNQHVTPARKMYAVIIARCVWLAPSARMHTTVVSLSQQQTLVVNLSEQYFLFLFWMIGQKENLPVSSFPLKNRIQIFCFFIRIFVLNYW